MALTGKELKKIKDFHGHLGPYAVTGFIIGKLAKKSFRKIDKIIVFNPLKTPQSCLIDGLQLSSGCTVGRNSINLNKSKNIKIKIEAEEKSLIIKLDRGFEKTAEKNFGRSVRAFAKNIEPLLNHFF